MTLFTNQRALRGSLQMSRAERTSAAAKKSTPTSDQRERPNKKWRATADLCRRHHIYRLSLFGSTLRRTNRPDSDVDLLVEFEPGKAPGLFALAGMEAEFSGLLSARRVDLRSPRDLSRHFRDEIVSTAEVQYAAAR